MFQNGKNIYTSFYAPKLQDSYKLYDQKCNYRSYIISVLVGVILVIVELGHVCVGPCHNLSLDFLIILPFIIPCQDFNIS